MNTEVVLRTGVSLARVGELLRFASVLGEGAESDCLRRDSELGDGDCRSGGPGSIGFEGVVKALFRLLSERRIRYILVGGVALLRYVPGRNTEDIDLLLAVDELEKLPELRLHDRQEWFAKADFLGLRVDLLLTSNPLFAAVLERRATVHAFRELEVPCATVEGLILLKLFALPSLYRQGNIQRANLYEADIAALLLGRSVDLEPLLVELSAHVPASDLRELRSILSEIEGRRERFRSDR